jgi:hypothetical protein
MEVETDLVIAEGLAFTRPADAQRAAALCDEISRMLTTLQRSLAQPERRAMTPER